MFVLWKRLLRKDCLRRVYTKNGEIFNAKYENHFDALKEEEDYEKKDDELSKQENN